MTTRKRRAGKPHEDAPKKGADDGRLAAAAWDGSPTTLNPQQNATMSQTTNGTMILAYFNQSSTNNAGKLSISSGGTGQLLNVPALTNQPLLLAKNWGGSNLSVSNISTTANTPIWISAAGPGLPGQLCSNLPSNGTFVPLAIFECAQGNPPPSPATVTLQANSGQLTVFAIMANDNVFVVALNAAQEAGPNANKPDAKPPAGYYATTTTNNYQGIWNWGGATVYVINLSPGTAVGAQVSLLSN